jgi:hypothetical protein
MAARFSEPYRNWLRTADTPQRPVETAPPASTRPEARDFIVPQDSDVQDAAIRVSMPRPAKALSSDDYTPDGTYIPLSGGMRGWYENSGVPNNEAPNHYRYRDALQSDAFKSTILERIETFNRRDSNRVRVDLWVKHSNPAHPDLKMTLRAYCVDLSLHGAKLRVRHALEDNEVIVISFFRQKADIENDEPLATTQAKVLHCRPAGGSAESPRFYIGVEFLDMEIAAKEAVARLMSSGTALVPVD